MVNNTTRLERSLVVFIVLAALFLLIYASPSFFTGNVIKAGSSTDNLIGILIGVVLLFSALIIRNLLMKRGKSAPVGIFKEIKIKKVNH